MRVRFDTIDIQSRVINKQVKSLLEYGNESWEAAWISRQRTPDTGQRGYNHEINGENIRYDEMWNR